MERFKCPKCSKILTFSAVELMEIGTPYCPDCGDTEVEMVIMDDPVGYKSLFYEEWESLNEAGEEVSDEIRAALRPIVYKHVTNGIKTIDIEHIAMSEINIMCAEMRLRRSMDKRKRKKTLRKKEDKS